MLVNHLDVFFGEMSVQFFGPFFDWVVYFSGIELHELLVYFLLILLSNFKPGTPEKAMAPHSSTLAWKIPWTEEPGRLQSMGSLRVGHD